MRTDAHNAALAWKDKILDYEIETGYDECQPHLSGSLEKIRFSITRLKRHRICESVRDKPFLLEKIRFSITRLKRRWNSRIDTKRNAWKDKILDYEIETIHYRFGLTRRNVTWKDKILDYEIETLRRNLSHQGRSRLLEKIRFSITRLKRDGEVCPINFESALKR